MSQVLGSAQTSHTQGFAATGALAALQQEPSTDAVFGEDGCLPDLYGRYICS